MRRIYTIQVCPACGDGPLVFGPNDEGMAPRTQCSRGHYVISGEARELRVAPAHEMPCFCGTRDASRCPAHINPVR